MNKTDWVDARVNKPRTDFTGVSDPVLVLTTDGVCRIAVWDEHIKRWYDPEIDEDFNNVESFYDFSVPHGWKFADFYYKRHEKYDY